MKKKTLILALVTILASACKDKPLLTPENPAFSGTTWISYMFGTVPGNEIYKVLEFKKGNQVEISYKAGGTRDFITVGTFNYNSDSSRFWIIGTNDKPIYGEIKGHQLQFENALYDRRK
ncbi:hypothetical protein LZD49_26290 [Dyadobacter sp. CY261]|uniref:hypothetical protein n=1 Tax=Dyadobacter sp. CY261 TaxID=2907203 RepID=UPI001F34B0D2|nr:hypothetical protein [Dyadobacter sp. CY261]MCF0074019.1 hypothetical protein [Dyadobacter sp. CY261]